MTTWIAPWDDGITWKTELVEADTTFLAHTVNFISSKVLRVATDVHEYDLVAHLIKAATAVAERETGDLITPATHRLYLSGWPVSGYIKFPGAPVRALVSVGYRDEAGDAQDLGSPVPGIFVPAGRFSKATYQLASGESFPSTATRPDAITIDYTVGYETPSEIPLSISQGIALVVGELYKNPDLSNAEGQEANTLNLARFFPRRW